MFRNTLPPRTRRTIPVALIVLLVALLLLGAGAFVPRLMALMGVRPTQTTPTAATGAPTQFVNLTLTAPPNTRTGLCMEHSAFVPRTDAWRCGVGTEVIDPCFSFIPSPGAPRQVVCGAEPVSGALGFLVDPGAGQPPARGEVAPPISPEQLESLTFNLGVVGEPVTLVNGQYYLPFVESLGTGVLVALSEMRASGDLDNDGDEDAAVLLLADDGGDSMFIYLGVIVNDNGTPRPVDAYELGDRVTVDNLQIDSGQIMVRMTTHAPDDPECCPTLDVTYLYNLYGDRLVQYVDGWRLELANGVQCIPVQARQSEGAAMPFAYQCSDGTWLRNGLHPGKTWYAEPIASQGGITDTTNYVPVERIWQ